MWFFKKSIKKKKEEAQELLRQAKRVWNYRRDVINEKDLSELEAGIETLSQTLKDDSVKKEDYEREMKSLDKVMRRCGGSLYPVGFWSDNAEMLLVAAILAIGVRTFFFQPFTIPTNSMYPTYYGMTSEVYQSEAQEPGLLKDVFRKIALGASHYTAKAPKSGDVDIPIFSPEDPYATMGIIRFKRVWGFKWLVIPTAKREYTFYVDGAPTKLRVPWEFSLEDVVQKAFYPEMEDIGEVFRNEMLLGNFKNSRDGILLKTNKYVKKGQNVIDFDILRGDSLFVDRISYHFVSPKVGDPIVFRGERVRGMNVQEREKYFIKRLVGLPGDELEVKAPILYRNGEPIQGAAAFEENALRAGKYPGYTAVKALEEGKMVNVPEGYLYAMGDNSPHSADSRYWGFVPEKSLVGRAFFIFYPFSDRWGMAK